MFEFIKGIKEDTVTIADIVGQGANTLAVSRRAVKTKLASLGTAFWPRRRQNEPLAPRTNFRCGGWVPDWALLYG
ncbi:hypothetical protein AGMMS49992_26400 [Clostridia bacterium]|nr:hypothetical protein AGMMS49992_26400 [Clostridia bacterium]